MVWLTGTTLARLRDQLRARGQRPSLVASEPGISPDEAELANVVAEFGPFCEAMYLMMSADGAVTEPEREVLKGALRSLSDNRIRTHHMEALLEKASKQAKDTGREKRLEEVTKELSEDNARAEVAFVLSAAIAFADNAIADEENEMLNGFAEALGIDDDRANTLLDEVEADLEKSASQQGA